MPKQLIRYQLNALADKDIVVETFIIKTRLAVPICRYSWNSAFMNYPFRRNTVGSEADIITMMNMEGFDKDCNDAGPLFGLNVHMWSVIQKCRFELRREWPATRFPVAAVARRTDRLHGCRSPILVRVCSEQEPWRNGAVSLALARGVGYPG